MWNSTLTLVAMVLVLFQSKWSKASLKFWNACKSSISFLLNFFRLSSSWQLFLNPLGSAQSWADFILLWQMRSVCGLENKICVFLFTAVNTVCLIKVGYNYNRSCLTIIIGKCILTLYLVLVFVFYNFWACIKHKEMDIILKNGNISNGNISSFRDDTERKSLWPERSQWLHQQME